MQNNILPVGRRLVVALACPMLLALSANAQYTTKSGNDSTTPLHLLKPNYDIPYGVPDGEAIKTVIDRVFNYLDNTTYAQLQNKTTGAAVDVAKADANSILKPGDYRLTSYEWGVTYGAMLEVGNALGDKKYSDYSVKRLSFLADVADKYRPLLKADPKTATPIRQVLSPHALDDAGAMAAAAIKTIRAGGVKANLRTMVDHYLDYVMTKEFRLADGTIARNRPLPNTLWLDDLYMALPAVAQMGVLTGDNKYFDEAVKQFRLYNGRMFNTQNQLYMHGWVQDMDPHPQFHWARANGWALLTATELLDALPANHPGRAFILEMYKKHAAGLAKLQDKTGFWHQLLDRNDSYLETSATAIYSYCIARGVNKGWLDAKAYGPMSILAWNAVATKVAANGQVEGTCVGTGMGFDPAFYYYRPINNFAAHGYGPVLMAGAEIYRLVKSKNCGVNDSAIHLFPVSPVNESVRK